MGSTLAHESLTGHAGGGWFRVTEALGKIHHQGGQGWGTVTPPQG